MRGPLPPPTPIERVDAARRTGERVPPARVGPTMTRLLIACVLACGGAAEDGAAPPDLSGLEPGPALSRVLPDPVPAGYRLPRGFDAVFRRGGGDAGLRPVESSLIWLRSMQEADGSWIGIREDEGEDRGGRVRGTALVLLAFYGAGYDHLTPNRYRDGIWRGIRFLIDAADPSDGRFARDPEVHALALTALAEGFAMTNDPRLRPPCRRGLEALDAMASASDAEGTIGWGPPEEECDIRSTSHAVMALRSLGAAGIDVGDRLAACHRLFHRLFVAANGEPERMIPVVDCAVFPSSWPARGLDDGELQVDGAAAARAAVMAGFLGIAMDGPIGNTLSNTVRIQAVRDWSDPRYDVEAAYWRTMVLFLAGGGSHLRVDPPQGVFRGIWRSGRTWTQMRAGYWYEEAGPHPGSYTPMPAFVERSGENRLLATAYGCLIQEFYYRPWLD